MVFEAANPDNTRVISITQLNRMVSQLLQGHIGRIWVKGEISNFTQAASGHWYFSIKDQSAMVRAVMFRSRSGVLDFVPKVGDLLEFFVSVTMYEARGEYQLQVESMRKAGRGNLYEAFLRLKDKLNSEGLFDSSNKKVINPMPLRLGVITSLSAAALQDVISSLKRRAPHIPVIVYPAAVQGRDAAPTLCAALQTAIDRAEVNTILMVRGGGSMEDLWSFNDEQLARLIYASPIPVISGVGHETDFTICDFVADLRAPTPTAAAELACYSRDACLQELSGVFNNLHEAHEQIYERAAMRLDRCTAKLVSPQQRLMQQYEKLGFLVKRLNSLISTEHYNKAAKINSVFARLYRCAPDTQAPQQKIHSLENRLGNAVGRASERNKQVLERLQYALSTLNPRNVLGRGYAIVRNSNQTVIKNALDLKYNELLSIEFDKGNAQVTVKQSDALL